MSNVLKLFAIAVLATSMTPAEAKKTKAQLAKEVAAEIARSEAWNKAKEKAKQAYQREKRCKNTQSGNHANSTAAVRTC